MTTLAVYSKVWQRRSLAKQFLLINGQTRTTFSFNSYVLPNNNHVFTIRGECYVFSTNAYCYHWVLCCDSVACCVSPKWPGGVHSAAVVLVCYGVFCTFSGFCLQPLVGVFARTMTISGRCSPHQERQLLYTYLMFCLVYILVLLGYLAVSVACWP